MPATVYQDPGTSGVEEEADRKGFIKELSWWCGTDASEGVTRSTGTHSACHLTNAMPDRSNGKPGKAGLASLSAP